MDYHTTQLSFIKKDLDTLAVFLSYTDQRFGYSKDISAIAARLQKVITEMELEADPGVQEEFYRHCNKRRLYA